MRGGQKDSSFLASVRGIAAAACDSQRIHLHTRNKIRATLYHRVRGQCSRRGDYAARYFEVHKHDQVVDAELDTTGLETCVLVRVVELGQSGWTRTKHWRLHHSPLGGLPPGGSMLETSGVLAHREMFVSWRLPCQTVVSS